LRRFPYEINELTEHITGPSHIVGNSGQLFVIQGQRLWIGKVNRMLLEIPIDVDFNVNFMEPFHNGIIMFTDKGIYRCDKNGNIHFVDEQYAKATTAGNGGVFFINLKDEVYFVKMVYQGDIPFPQLQMLSDNIYNINWGANPQMIYFDGALWISREDDVYAFDQGAWTKRYVFDDRIIYKLSNFKNELVIAFKNSSIAVTPDYFEVYVEGGDL